MTTVYENGEVQLLPRESGHYIAENSSHVSINGEAVKDLANKIFQSLESNEYSIKQWKQHTLHPKKMIKETVDWIFVVDTLNFSFWSETHEKRYLVEFKGQQYSGYWALCAVINRAIDEGIPITDPSYYSKITDEQMKHIFRSASSTCIPLLEQRKQHLHEAGSILLQKFNGSFANCVQECSHNAQALLKLIVSNFPSYRDVGMYKDKKVSFYKRAQILIADIWACFEGKTFGEFHDIDSLTMFADYRVPQVLNYFGVIRYSDHLTRALHNNEITSHGDPLEVEIRGCSIWAVELIIQEVQKKLKGNGTKFSGPVNSIIVDFYLWDYSKDYWRAMKHIPIHRLRCTYY
ncbi:Queuosine salvage protein [Holothuria leucospilota]|uniref:Queuosine 5'-phosphate N-glycosylase/hydrolase n=1 Tax=Holothuria leucospilota TaxID=206669 RepID=A0A9Q1CLI1_HOLLE|nr:Queuosine salvage protein [Holothuria leucospilota]